MRTTIRLPEDLLAEAKQHAVKTGRTLTALIEDALRMALRSERPRPARVREEIPTYGKGGINPAVDLDSNVSLLDFMDLDGG